MFLLCLSGLSLFQGPIIAYLLLGVSLSAQGLGICIHAAAAPATMSVILTLSNGINASAPKLALAAGQAFGPLLLSSLYELPGTEVHVLPFVFATFLCMTSSAIYMWADELSNDDNEAKEARTQAEYALKSLQSVAEFDEAMVSISDALSQDIIDKNWNISNFDARTRVTSIICDALPVASAENAHEYSCNFKSKLEERKSGVQAGSDRLTLHR